MSKLGLSVMNLIRYVQWIKTSAFYESSVLFFLLLARVNSDSYKKEKHHSKSDAFIRVIAPGFEPGTVCLEGRCSIQLSYATIVATKLPIRRRESKEEATRPLYSIKKGMIAHPLCRGGRIRTCDLLLPKQAR